MTKLWTLSWILLVCLLSAEDFHTVKAEKEFKDGRPATEEEREVAIKLNFMHLNSDALEAEGKHEESLALLEQIYPLERKILGPNNTLPFITLSKIADRLIALNRVNDALAVYWKIYKFRKTVLGPTHLETLEILHYLSRLYIQLGKATKALGFLKRVYKHRKSLLGPEHLDTIDTLHEIANAMSQDKDKRTFLPVERDLEEDKKIISYYKKVLEVRRRELGPHEKLTLDTLSDLGTFYIKAKMWEESLEPLQTVLAMRLLGDDDPLTFKVKEKLSWALAQLGRKKKAMALFDTLSTTSGNEEVHPPRGQVQAKIIEGMADVHRKRYKEALSTFEGVLTSLSENHPEAPKIMKTLIALYRHFGDRKRAILMAKELIALIRKNNPLNHREILDNWEGMVEIYLKMKDKKQMYEAIYELIEWAENTLIEGSEDVRLYKVLRIAASQIKEDDKKSLVEKLKLYEMLQKVVSKMPVTRNGELRMGAMMIQFLKYKIDPDNNPPPELDQKEQKEITEMFEENKKNVEDSVTKRKKKHEEL